MKKKTKEKLSRSSNNSHDKKGLSKTVISLITAIIILVVAVGFLTNYYFASQAVMEKNKSIYINLMNKNAELMNMNAEITKKLLETRSNLKTTRFELAVAEAKLEKATFELGEDMLTLPMESPQFDCDDSALYMYLYFTNLGYDVRIIAGNLDLGKETFEQCDHVWVWVDDGIKGELPYDWGYFDNDEQHSYGYIINYKELLRKVINDQ